ncbi:hypothetical protein PLICRDRAFT_53444 [Plicaturopsis crispa FD-325 SS-3]|nr:hypothetical protein PLICRDRAFT_53444 [Plicaturopsis crispa FD-325 SS-3]
MESPDAPPSYWYPRTIDDPPSSPTYSPCPANSERVLQLFSCSHLHRVGSGSADPDFVYKTEHMEVNLGPRAFCGHIPAFGWRGTVLGHARFSGDKAHVVKVTVTLKAEITTTAAERGIVASYSNTSLLCETITLYSPSAKNTPWDGDHTFEIPFPSQVSIKQGTIHLPPSFNTLLPGTTCNVTYMLKVDMTRKGLRRHESINVPILYLPKSRPSVPPLLSIPLPALANVDVPFPVDDRIFTVKMAASWPNTSRAADPSDTSRALYLSLPSPACFTSGDNIPLVISLVMKGDPSLAKLLAPKIRVTLVKRTRVWRAGGVDILRVRNMPIASVDSWRVHESSDESVSRLQCELQAGSAGQENSWGIEGIVDTQYFIRVVLSPPCSVSGHVPSFRHEEPVKIMTDPWGHYERELLSTGGVPTPALGLAAPLRDMEALRRAGENPGVGTSFSHLSVYR